MIRALRKPQIKILWLGQAFSSLGDEIYRVGLIWLAVGLLGANTGYLAAGQTASLMLLSFIGGKWADQWNPRRTMIVVDLIRTVIVLIPVIVSFFMPVPAIVLWIMAFSVAGLSAFFDPATQGLIPILAETKELMQATNGLMSTTIRMARMIGPSIVGLLSVFIPMVHFFSIDAFTFLISAYCVYTLKKYIPHTDYSKMPKTNFKKSITAGFVMARNAPGMGYVFFSKALTTGVWNLVLTIGFPLLVHDMTGGDATYFGFVMASYGIGNFIGALYFGSMTRVNSWWLYFAGLALLGVGFVGIGIAPNVGLIMLAAAVGGFFGPMNDITFVDMLQQNFPTEMTKMFRFRMMTEAMSTLFFTLISPWLIKTTSVRTAIVIGGSIWILSGLIGLIFKEKWHQGRAANQS